MMARAAMNSITTFGEQHQAPPDLRILRKNTCFHCDAVVNLLGMPIPSPRPVSLNL